MSFVSLTYIVEYYEMLNSRFALEHRYTSNRAHFRRLRKDEMLKQVDSEYQYVLMTGSMDKETRFQELKRETAFAREVMSKWNLSKVDTSLRTAFGKRKQEVMFLLCDQSSLWFAKSRLAVATEAVRAAVKKLAEDTSRDDIDNRVVKTAIDILNKSLDSVVKTVFDVFKAQAQALTAAGKPPALNHRTKATAQSAAGIGTKGSFFAWHGSQVARWHLMIRTWCSSAKRENFNHITHYFTQTLCRAKCDRTQPTHSYHCIS